MNCLTLCCCLLFIASAATAQDKEVQAIRMRHQEMAKKIQLLEQDPQNAGLYVHRISLNDKGGSWPGVGNYKKSIRFYFELGEENAHGLIRIDLTGESASRRDTTEYLFDAKSQLVFWYYKGHDEDVETAGKNIEKRYYFSGGELIRHTQTPFFDARCLPAIQKSAKELIIEADNLQLLFKAIDK